MERQSTLICVYVSVCSRDQEGESAGRYVKVGNIMNVSLWPKKGQNMEPSVDIFWAFWGFHWSLLELITCRTEYVKLGRRWEKLKNETLLTPADSINRKKARLSKRSVFTQDMNDCLPLDQTGKESLIIRGTAAHDNMIEAESLKNELSGSKPFSELCLNLNVSLKMSLTSKSTLSWRTDIYPFWITTCKPHRYNTARGLGGEREKDHRNLQIILNHNRIF